MKSMREGRGLVHAGEILPATLKPEHRPLGRRKSCSDIVY